MAILFTPYQQDLPMKHSIAFLLLLFLSLPAAAQKKGKVDPKQVTIDSLMKVTSEQAAALTAANARMDSTSRELARYQSMHKAIQEKVIKYDFAPERTDELIDSLK